MSFRTRLGMLGSVSCCLLFASISHAQCSKDTDCKGDRICEEGACVDPSTALPPPPAPPSGAQPSSAAQPAPASAAAPPAPPPVYAPPPLRDTSVQDLRPRTQRHSPGMMAGGIVMASIAPIFLLAAMIANSEQDACQGRTLFGTTDSPSGVNCGRFDATIYTGLFGGAVLLAVGIPMIVIGSKREPLGTARVAPWASPHGAGLGLRFDL